MSGQQIVNSKYRNWVKAGLGLKYVKEGLEPFCDDIVRQQHADILHKVKQKHNLRTVNCGQCQNRTLQPDHVRIKNRQCPLRLKDCNCLYPDGKVYCPNNACSAIYDEIINLHASTPPAPYWRNTDVQLWCTEPWAVAKCFINAPGYTKKMTASEIDCSGLLHLLINNKDLQAHITCSITGNDVFSKVRQHRNTIFHSDNMEIEDADVIAYIDDMIDVLQDSKELNTRPDSQAAVNKLKQLQQHDFTITTSLEAEVKAARQSIKELQDELEQKGSDIKVEVQQEGSSNIRAVKQTGSDMKAEVQQEGSSNIQAVKQTGSDMKVEVQQEGSANIRAVKQTGSDMKAEVQQEGSSNIQAVKQTGSDMKAEVQQEGSSNIQAVKQTGSDMIVEVQQEGSSNIQAMKQTGSDMIVEVQQEGSANIRAVKQTGSDMIVEVQQEGSATIQAVKQTGSDMIVEVQQEGSANIRAVKQTGSDMIVEVQQEGSSNIQAVKQTGSDMIVEVQQEGSANIQAVKQTGSDMIVEVQQEGSANIQAVKQTGSDMIVEVQQEGSANIRAVKRKSTAAFKQEMTKTGSVIERKVRRNVLKVAEQKETELEQAGSNIMKKLEEKGADIQKEIKESVSKCAESDQEREYSKMKKDLKTKLLDMYQEVTKISALPLLPDDNLTDVADVYVEPLLTVERQDYILSMESESQSKAVGKQTMDVSVSDIFKKDETSVKLIYVLGQAGSGKSTFCKYLVSYWCAAHSGKKCRTIDTDLVNEMGRFAFLFYIALRHYPDCHSIKGMLHEVYSDPVLEKLLQNESESCLIVLDGLDEWTPQGQKLSMFQTKGLPERDISKKYTIITTSRPWKFTSVRIKESEIGQTIKLKGINATSVYTLTTTTVNLLNKRFQKEKAYHKFRDVVDRSPVSEMCQVPLLLQQLICLWFDERLKGTSKCSVYSSMLELFFEWSAQRDPECQTNVQNDSSIEMADLQLPGYLSDSDICCDNKYVIYCLSRLAYEALFDRKKEKSLTFTSSKLQQLEITNDIKSCGLRTGILSEDRGVTLLASRRRQSSYSFHHKSIQEFLAAVYIAVHFEKMSKASSAADPNHDVGTVCLLKYIGACETVDDILEQSDLLIMLCGLNPELVTCISKYIFDIVSADQRVRRYRKFYQEEHQHADFKLVGFIQKCILGCIEEIISSGKPFPSRVYLGDIIIKRNYMLPFLNEQIISSDNFTFAAFFQDDNLLLALDNQVILPNTVRSLKLTSDEQYNESAMELLSNCKQLKKIQFCNDHPVQGNVSEFDKRIGDILVCNVSTLECVDICSIHEQLVETLLQNLPDMHQLISLRTQKIFSPYILSHEACSTLSASLTQLTCLQQISIRIPCQNLDKHMIQLSNQGQLQYVDLLFSSFCVTKLNTETLDTCIVGIDNVDELIQTCDNLYKARNLKCLNLYFIQFMKINTVAEWETVTENVSRLLSSLTSLRTLELHYFTFTDNIITHPAVMHNLQNIELNSVTISETTYRKFRNGLSELPQTVHVKIRKMKITAEGKESDYFIRFADEMSRRSIQEKSKLLRITDKSGLNFSFKTMKTQK